MTSEEASAPATPNALPEALCTTVLHRVAFYETDAMGIVHHANYPRFFEEARVRWLDEHDQSYSSYLSRGLHFAVTRCEVDFHQSARFDEALEIKTALDWVRGASLRMIYFVECAGRLIASGATEHAAVDDSGRVRRIPREDRARLLPLARDQRRSRRPSTI
ncbi:acyl-CoA thioesterase [Myxococcota bacterium]|nr:acyl-CoA thioesterase [Myxococcota bacterium]